MCICACVCMWGYVCVHVLAVLCVGYLVLRCVSDRLYEEAKLAKLINQNPDPTLYNEDEMIVLFKFNITKVNSVTVCGLS